MALVNIELSKHNDGPEIGLVGAQLAPVLLVENAPLFQAAVERFVTSSSLGFKVTVFFGEKIMQSPDAERFAAVPKIRFDIFARLKLLFKTRAKMVRSL